jgi:pimeloyl-ACP methyl ester carboxylesterase
MSEGTRLAARGDMAKRARVLGTTMLLAAGLSVLTACDDVIEKEYTTPPARPVTWTDSNPADDADPPDGFPPGQKPKCSGAYTYFYPTDLGGPAGTEKHPVLTWGNGTGADACAYSSALLKLAAWGYVVVAVNSPRTGLGTEIFDAASHLVNENANPASPFHDKLDLTRIGAIGHSQGAGGAIRAAIASNGLIKSVVALSLTDPLGWVPVGIPAPDTRLLSAPTFYVRGSNDFLATELGAELYYGGTPVGAAKAALKGADHNNLTAAAGYVTAWLKFTLEGDTRARGAFVGNPPELLANADEASDPWENAKVKNIQ